MYFRETISYNWNTPSLGISVCKNWETVWPIVNDFVVTACNCILDTYCVIVVILKIWNLMFAMRDWGREVSLWSIIYEKVLKH